MGASPAWILLGLYRLISGHTSVSAQKKQGEKQLSIILIKQEARQLHREEQLKAGSFNVEIIVCTGEIVPLLEKKKKKDMRIHQKKQ